MSHTFPIRSNVVNVFRVGRVEALANQEGIGCSQADIDFLGLTGVFTDIPDTQRGCPGVGMQGYTDAGGAVNEYTASNQPMWDISNTTTWVTGNHTLNFGANYRRWSLQRDTAADLLGNFGGFNIGTFTGNSVADFLLGYYGSTAPRAFQPGPFSSAGAVGNPYEFNWMYFAPYIQDDWKVSSKLTVNLGLRYDYRNVPYETNDHMAWRNLDYAPGGLLVADETLASGGVVDGAYYQAAGRRSPENPDRYKVFAPRIGFAYRPTASGNTVFRAGYGIFYDSAETARDRRRRGCVSLREPQHLLPDPRPDGAAADDRPVVPELRGRRSGDARGQRLPRGEPVSGAEEPHGPAVVCSESSASFRGRPPAELNYVGAHGSNLLMRINIAQALPYTAANPTVAGRKPFPNFGTYIDSDWSGFSDYHALNATLTHRGRGLLASVAYTWAKSTDSKSSAAALGANESAGWQGFLNNHDVARDHGLSGFDVAHRLSRASSGTCPSARASDSAATPPA